jgi:hypothetical protein
MPKVGDVCTPDGGDISITCEDATNGLVCQDGKLISVPCRGPKGCNGTGPSAACDDDLGTEGEACIMTSPAMRAQGFTNLACTMEQKAMLACASGKWKLKSWCRGPMGCAVKGSTLHCDDDYSDVGDPCHTEPTNANYSCTPDKTSLVVCRNDTFVLASACKGPKGCRLESDNKIHCDTTIGAEGDSCMDVGTVACTADAQQTLSCSPLFKWVKGKDCKTPCSVNGKVVECK